VSVMFLSAGVSGLLMVSKNFEGGEIWGVYLW
jgi:hypothetical protein